VKSKNEDTDILHNIAVQRRPLQISIEAAQTGE
jgi:hypothetical protein